MPFKPSFWYEVCTQPPDDASGAMVYRLTSAASISHNIYCEQPYTSPDGRRVAIIRSTDFNANFPRCDLLVIDLPTSQLAFAARDVHSQIVNTAWGEHVFYWKPDGKFYRLSLLTLEEKMVLDKGDRPPVRSGLSISPDLKFLAYGTAIPGEKAARYGVVFVDLESGAWKMVYEHPDMVNSHTQFEPTDGKTLLLQQNIEPKALPDGSVTSLGLGAVLVTVNSDGTGAKQLAVGPPHTSGCTGHQAFIPGSRLVALTTGSKHDLEATSGGRGNGNLLIVGPDDKEARVFNAPDCYFMHVSLSRCGRFFIADSYGGLKDPVPLIIGCMKTGKYRAILRDCHGTHGPCQWGHAHAYLTADNRHVIFNSDHQGIGQVYCATVPEGFLEGLL